MTYSNPATQGKKITIIFGVVLSVLVLLTINPVIDNDFWFLLKGGDYVMAMAFPIRSLLQCIRDGILLCSSGLALLFSH